MFPLTTEISECMECICNAFALEFVKISSARHDSMFIVDAEMLFVRPLSAWPKKLNGRGSAAFDWQFGRDL